MYFRSSHLPYQKIQFFSLTTVHIFKKFNFPGNTFYEVWGREIFNDDAYVTGSVRKGLEYDNYFKNNLARQLDPYDLGRVSYTNQFRQNWDTFKDAVFIKKTTTTTTTTP